jgi:hypothetical protein
VHAAVLQLLHGCFANAAAVACPTLRALLRRTNGFSDRSMPLAVLCAGPPIAAKNSHCGYISAINKIGDNTGVGVIYFIGAGLWTLESLWSVWVYKSVYRSFRGQGMTAAQVKRDAKRGAASQAAASVV